MRKPRIERFRPAGANYEIRVVGVRATPLRDFYHAMLRSSWAVTFAVLSVSYLVLNVLFALAYYECHGIANAQKGSLFDAFFFSVQTMGTIGYGAMYPLSRTANFLVAFESLVSLLFTALATGVIFAKVSRASARVVFSRHVVISPFDGTPTLVIRLGNERGNRIMDAQINVALMHNEITAEGRTFYRMLDIRLTRERAQSLQRSLILLHPIDESSPFYGATPESLVAEEAELNILLVGLDDITMQTVHASHRYFAHDIVFGARHADVLSEADDGALELDLRKFHEIEPTDPTASFPYPRA